MTFVLIGAILAIWYVLQRIGLARPRGFVVYRRIAEKEARADPDINVQEVIARIRLVQRWQYLPGGALAIGFVAGIYILQYKPVVSSYVLDISMALIFLGFIAVWVIRYYAHLQGLTRFIGWGRFLSSWDYVKKYDEAAKEIKRERRRFFNK